jgi:hypothetical protein
MVMAALAAIFVFGGAAENEPEKRAVVWAQAGQVGAQLCCARTVAARTAGGADLSVKAALKRRSPCDGLRMRQRE